MDSLSILIIGAGMGSGENPQKYLSENKGTGIFMQIDMHLRESISAPALLEQLIEGTLSAVQIDQVIDLAVYHARKYIHWMVWHRGYHLGPTGLSADDLAYDLVAELVSELDGEVLGRLRQALSSLTGDPDAPYDMESAFIAVVNRSVRFNIVRLFMDINPVHARLLRALRRYVHASAELDRIDSIGGFWYARRGIDAALHRPPAPLDLLRGAVSPAQLNGNPVRTVLHGSLDLLGDQEEYRRAVLEHDVLDMTMSLLQLHHAGEATPEEQSPDVGDVETASAALLESLEDARGWVQEKYVSRGKLGTREAEAMLEAIHRYIEDLQQRDVLGHFSYLRRSMPGLTQQRYRKSYRNVYEYILRTIFTNARQRLE